MTKGDLMPSSRPTGLPTYRRSARRDRLTAAVASVVALALLGGVALASSATRVVGEANNTALKQTIVVDAHGRTLYALRPESVHHLLCRSAACFEIWPPLTVRSAGVRLVAGHGVEGRLGLLRRSDGKLQVTLRGLPLYRYAGDGAAGQANGQGIRTFGGTWHALAPSLHAASAPGPPAPAPAPAPMPQYGY
jgi:predicted lipoprotein with Yx(FWY)xxD motif